MKLQLPYPVKPYLVNQPWGVPNDIYRQFGFTQHNGVDVKLGLDKAVYSEIKGTVIAQKFQPFGGGLYLTVVSDEMYDFPDCPAYVSIDYLHLEKYLCKVGDSVEVGKIIAIADNTGFSTGPHTHIQYRRILKTPAGFQEIDINEANNSFNPEPYRTGEFACDIFKVGILTKIRDLYIKLLQLIK